jgi:hypothetical protein
MAQQPSKSDSSAAKPASGPVITLQEQGKPAHKCRLVKSWKTAEGAKAYLVVAIDTNEKMTIVESGPATTVPGTESSTRARAVATKIYHWKKDDVSPTGAPVVPAEVVVASTPVCCPPAPATSCEPCATPTTHVAEAETPKRSVFRPRTWFQQDEPAATTVTTTTPVKTFNDGTAQPGMTAIPVKSTTTVAQTAVAKPAENATTSTTAQPPDWRQSWGKANDFSASPAAKPQTPPAPLPQATTSANDPLATPSKYSQLPKRYAGYAVSMDDVTASTTADAKKAGTGQTPAPSAKPAVAQTVATTPPAQPSKVVTFDVTHAPAMAPAAPANPPVTVMAPLDFSPVPAAPLNVRVPQAPQPIVQRPTYNAQQPVRPWSVEPITGSPDAANAFTKTPTPEMVTNNSNAFYTPDFNNRPSVNGNNMPNPVPGAMPRGYVMQPQYNGAALAPNGYVDARNYGANMQASYNTPAAWQVSAQTGQMLATLKDSLYPSQRECAAEWLANLDWHVNSQITPALISAAREDPAASVRAACVRSLGKMQANTMPVIDCLQSLRADTDPRVRQEVENALAALTPSSHR